MNRMPNNAMYQGSNQQGPQQYMNNPQGQNYGNFQNQGQNQFYMQQGQGPQRPNYGGQMGMRPQNQGQFQGGYMGGPGGPQGGPGYRPPMNQMQQNQQNMMRMQNPQLMAQLQRGPQASMNQQQMNPGQYGGQQGNHY